MNLVYASNSMNMKPQATIVVHKHAVGADMVEITMLDPNFSMSTLKDCCLKMAGFIGSTPRGLNLYSQELDPQKAHLKFLKARFALDGLINSAKKEYHLEPIVKAFAGLREPYSIKRMSVHFAGEQPSRQTLGELHSDAVDVVGDIQKGFKGIEYQVVLKSQNPESIKIPSHLIQGKGVLSSTTGFASWSPIWKFFAILAGSFSIGLMVYLYIIKFILKIFPQSNSEIKK